MIKKIIIIFFILTFGTYASPPNYFNEAKDLYEKKDFEKSKFLFQRNIVFNPKDHLSYLYLAKIFKGEKNKEEHEKNLNTTLLLDPKNEEALYMLIEVEIEKSNFDKVSELNETFSLVCKNMCTKKKAISKKLKDLKVNNE